MRIGMVMVVTLSLMRLLIIVLTKLLNQQKEKIGTITQQIKTQVEPDIDILKVDETSNESMNESDNENSNETNNNSESSETKQIKLN